MARKGKKNGHPALRTTDSTHGADGDEEDRTSKKMRLDMNSSPDAQQQHVGQQNIYLAPTKQQQIIRSHQSVGQAPVLPLRILAPRPSSCLLLQ